jgi:large subunit ribosomal protein L9
MKVILIRDVTSLGQEGDVVEVSDGHARNFLFPQNLAVQATPETLQKKKEQEEAKKRTDNKAMSSAGQSAKELDGQEIVLKEKVNESGVLYAAVTSKAIAKALKDLGHKVKPDMIKISDPIKELGTYTVMIELNHGFEAEVNISIEEK